MACTQILVHNWGSEQLGFWHFFADGLGQAMIINFWKVDNTISWISLSPVVSATGFSNTHPLNSDLSNG